MASPKLLLPRFYVLSTNFSLPLLHLIPPCYTAPRGRKMSSLLQTPVHLLLSVHYTGGNRG